MSTNYYQILGIEKKANLQEIKKSYRNLAKLWHPDRNNNSPESVSKFKLISEAYETLSNKRTREEYDEQLEYGNMRINGSPYSDPLDMFNKVFMDNMHSSYDVFDTPFFQTENDAFEYGDNLFGPNVNSSNSNYKFTIDGDSYEEMKETRDGTTRTIKRKNGVIISDMTIDSKGNLLSDKQIKN